MIVATVSGAMAKIIKIEVHSVVQQNSGMRNIDMPGQRCLYRVTAKLSPVRVEPIDARVTDQIQ